MPNYRALVTVTIKKSILDPQGRAVEATLKRLGHVSVEDVRVGKHIELVLSGERETALAELEQMATTVLSNPVMEDVSYTLTEVEKVGSG